MLSAATNNNESPKTSYKRHTNLLTFTGDISVVCGPMYSGKSTELIRRIRLHKWRKQRSLVIKHKLDTRYTMDEILATHDGITDVNAVICETLFEVYDKALECDVIGIDEGQFYPDLIEFCELMANYGKNVIVAGLSGTFERKAFNNCKQFTNVLDLIPLAENVTMLKSICSKCLTLDASFTWRTVENKNVQVIGGPEMYIPLCRKCYFEMMKM